MIFYTFLFTLQIIFLSVHIQEQVPVRGLARSRAHAFPCLVTGFPSRVVPIHTNTGKGVRSSTLTRYHTDPNSVIPDSGKTGNPDHSEVKSKNITNLSPWGLTARQAPENKKPQRYYVKVTNVFLKINPEEGLVFFFSGLGSKSSKLITILSLIRMINDSLDFTFFCKDLLVFSV